MQRLITSGLSILAAALWISLAGASPAAAQQTAKVLAACGTASYTAGSVNYATIDTTGAQCGASGGSSTVVGNKSNASSGQATSTNNVGSVAYNYGFNGATWDQLQVDTSKNLKVTLPGAAPAACTATTVATGGTAITTVTGPVNGGYLTNPPNTASQGVTSENAYVSLVGTPGSTDSTGNGTTSILAAGQNFTFGPIPTGSVIKVNAATTGHKISCATW